MESNCQLGCIAIRLQVPVTAMEGYCHMIVTIDRSSNCNVDPVRAHAVWTDLRVRAASGTAALARCWD